MNRRLFGYAGISLLGFMATHRCVAQTTAPPGAPGKQPFNFQTVVHPGNNVVSTELLSINDRGVALGIFTCSKSPSSSTNTADDPCAKGDPSRAPHAFTYQSGKFTDLSSAPFNGNDVVKPLLINNNDEILLQDSAMRYLIYSLKDGTYLRIGMNGKTIIDGKTANIQLVAITGMNDKGEIVGSFHGVVLDAQIPGGYRQATGFVVGKPTTGAANSLGPPPADAATYTYISAKCPSGGQLSITGLNNQGQFTGQCIGPRLARLGVIASTTSASEISYSGASSITPTSINDHSVVVGSFIPTGGPGLRTGSAFLYDGSDFTPLGAAPQEKSDGCRQTAGLTDGSASCGAFGINNRGQIVGTFTGPGIESGFITGS